MRLGSALLMLMTVLATTVYPGWGHGTHPSQGIRPAPFGSKYIDIDVPKLPASSIVLIATMQPAAYFIPFAEPTARYIGLKTTANDQFARLLTPLVSAGTAIVTLQNGLGNEATLAGLFGAEKILGGLCFVCLNRTAPGHIEHTAHGHHGDRTGTG